LTRKFARRFVIGEIVKINVAHRYLEDEARTCETAFCLATERLHKGDFTMRKTILTILGSALLAASTVQIAAAAEHHKAREVYRAPAPVSEDFRNSNAYAPLSPWAQPGWSRYENGAMSAPAGH
jgi:hypothetical protein